MTSISSWLNACFDVFHFGSLIKNGWRVFNISRACCQSQAVIFYDVSFTVRRAVGAPALALKEPAFPERRVDGILKRGKNRVGLIERAWTLSYLTNCRPF